MLKQPPETADLLKAEDLWQPPAVKEIDWAEFDKLCLMHATLEEIAGWFEVSTPTVTARVKEEYGRSFSEVWTEKSAAGKASLRRKQFIKAMEGNSTMLVWLGKQYLGQSDKKELSGPDARPITVASISVNTTPEEAALAYGQMIKGTE